MHIARSEKCGKEHVFLIFKELYFAMALILTLLIWSFNGSYWLCGTTLILKRVNVNNLLSMQQLFRREYANPKIFYYLHRQLRIDLLLVTYLHALPHTLFHRRPATHREKLMCRIRCVQTTSQSNPSPSHSLHWDRSYRQRPNRNITSATPQRREVGGEAQDVSKETVSSNIQTRNIEKRGGEEGCLFAEDGARISTTLLGLRSDYCNSNAERPIIKNKRKENERNKKRETDVHSN